MNELPKKVSQYLSQKDKNEVQTWWEELNTEDQALLVKSYVLERLHRQSPETLRFYGKFVEGKEKPKQNEFWAVELFEYFTNHEIILTDDVRTYHTCYQQAKAIKACKQGIIPSNFVCPVGKTDCLMTKLTRLGAGKDLRLFIKIDELQ